MKDLSWSQPSMNVDTNRGTTPRADSVNLLENGNVFPKLLWRRLVPECLRPGCDAAKRDAVLGRCQKAQTRGSQTRRLHTLWDPP